MRSLLVVGVLTMAVACSAGFEVDEGPFDGGPASDAGARSDGTTVRVDGGDPKGPKDGGPSKRDVAVTDPPPDVCAPANIAGFVPAVVPPAPARSGKCSVAQLEAIIDCTFDANAGSNACDTLLDDAANQACTGCILTDVTQPAYGPIIVDDNIARLNVAGCVARASNDLSATGCGARLASAEQCADAACAASCPLLDDVSYAQYEQCTEDAMAGPCSAYADSLACLDAVTSPSGAAAQCALENDFISTAKAYARLFCTAPTPVDAGAGG